MTACVCALLAVGSTGAPGAAHAQATSAQATSAPAASAQAASAPAVSVPAASAPAARRGGIWKAAVPPKPMKGEFDNLDPLGVAAGASIKADCSLNWINPDDDRLYCFSSGTSLEIFLEKPHRNLERARAVWQRLAAQEK